MLNKIAGYLKERKLLVLIVFVYFLIMLFKLDQLNLLRGERDIVLTGYSLAKTGRDLYGRFLPHEFTGLDMPTPMLAFYYSALWWLILPVKTIFFARLPFVILSLTLPFLVYEIILTVTKNKPLAFLSAVVFYLSPGMFHLSRLALEVGVATPLLLLGILLYLKQKRYWSYLVFILSFFTYNGFRPLLPFLLIYLEFFFYLKHRNPKVFIKENIKNILFFAVIFIFSATLVDGGMMASRKDNLVFIGYKDLAPKVDYRRNTAIGPENLKQLFNNKITATIYYMIDVFVKGQDLGYLFLHGDYSILYATTFTGQFFLIGLFFYYLGFIYLGKKWNRDYFYLLGLVPVALIPSVINIDYISVSIRSILASAIYGFIIACGVYLFFSLIKKLKVYIKFPLILAIAVFLIVELSYFFYNYYYRRPITIGQIFFESERQIAGYLIDNKKNYTVFTDSPRDIMASYVFFKGNADIRLAQSVFNRGVPYSYDGIKFEKCPENIDKFQLKKGMIINESCTGKDAYERFKNTVTKKIDYTDYSFRTAFFIAE